MTTTQWAVLSALIVIFAAVIVLGIVNDRLNRKARHRYDDGWPDGS